MSSSWDGGPAFPTLPDTPPKWDGMSLRDYFAAQAIAGMQARDMFDAGQATPQQRAHLAYIEADAMLSERAKANTP